MRRSAVRLLLPVLVLPLVAGACREIIDDGAPIYGWTVVTGEVRRVDGTPHSGAWASVLCREVGGRHAKTDSTGRYRLNFQLNSLPAGAAVGDVETTCRLFLGFKDVALDTIRVRFAGTFADAPVHELNYQLDWPRRDSVP